MTAVSVSAQKDDCSLCTTVDAALETEFGVISVGCLLFGAAVLTGVVMFKWGITFIMLGLVASFLGAITTGTFVAANGFYGSFLYHFFDSSGVWHYHKENPTHTPKQFWEDGKERAVVLVRYTGWFNNKYGIVLPGSTGWAAVDSWGGRITLRGHYDATLNVAAFDALLILETGERSVRELCGQYSKQDSELLAKKKRITELEKGLEQVSNKADRAFEGLIAIKVWLERPERKRSRWKHATELKRLLQVKINNLTAGMSETVRAHRIETVQREAEVWLHSYEQGRQKSAEEAEKADSAVRAALDNGEAVTSEDFDAAVEQGRESAARAIERSGAARRETR